MREPGIYHGIPIEEYHGDSDYISKSGLDEMAASPRRWWGNHLDPKRPLKEREETASQLVGNLAHCAILEPMEFNKRYKVGPEVTSKRVKAWTTFKDDCEAAGITPIDRERYVMAWKMRESVMAIPDAARILAEGAPEVSAYWVDPATGSQCRCRPDWVHPANASSVILADVKTYTDAQAAEFSRQVARMRYHVQDAFYTDGYSIASGKEVKAFLFIAVETAYPHVANVMMLDEDSREVGRRLYRRDLEVYAECRKTDVWPGYGDDIKLIELPYWAKDAA